MSPNRKKQTMTKSILFFAAILFAFGIIVILVMPDRNLFYLTPIFIGGLILLSALLSFNKELYMFSKHAATSISLLGFIATGGSWRSLFSWESMDAVKQHVAVVHSITALLCIVFMVYSVVMLRKERLLEEEEQNKK